MSNSNTARVAFASPLRAKSLSTEHTACVLNVIEFVPRDERDARAAALHAAMTDTRTSNRALAAKLGVSEGVVRGLRSGARPLRDDRIAMFGPRLRAAFDVALREAFNEALRGPVQLRLF